MDPALASAGFWSYTLLALVAAPVCAWTERAKAVKASGAWLLGALGAAARCSYTLPAAAAVPVRCLTVVANAVNASAAEPTGFCE